MPQQRGREASYPVLHRDPVRGWTDPATGAPDTDAPMVEWTNLVMEAPDLVVELPEHTLEHPVAPTDVRAHAHLCCLLGFIDLSSN